MRKPEQEGPQGFFPVAIQINVTYPNISGFDGALRPTTDKDLLMFYQLRILLADDHAIVLQGFQRLLEGKYSVIGLVSQGAEVVEKARILKPDCVLLDISIGKPNGFDIARRLKSLLPKTKIIFVTMHAEPIFVKEAFQIGVDGYILKQSAASELLEAICQVMRNHRYISPHLPEEVREVAEAVAEGMPVQEYSGRLTEQQQKVLGLLAKGYSSKKIGKTLGISLSTIAFHKTNIMRALGVKTSAELTKYAVSAGFVSLDE